MAITVPARFPLRAAQLSADVASGLTINADPDLLTTLDACTNRYAENNLRALMQLAPLNPLITTVSAASSREELIVIEAQIAEARDDLAFVVDGYNLDYEITVKDSTDTTTLASDTGTISTRATATATLSTGTTGQSVIIRLKGKRQNDGFDTEARVHGVRVLELPATAANLPG